MNSPTQNNNTDQVENQQNTTLNNSRLNLIQSRDEEEPENQPNGQNSDEGPPRSFEKRFEKYHEKFAARLNLISCETAFLRVVDLCPDTSYEICYMPWDFKKKNYDFSTFNHEQLNPDINKKKIESVNFFFFTIFRYWVI